MDAKNLERLMESHGANASAFAVVVRTLRAALKVSVGGRGPYAHDLTGSEMTWIVASYIASDIAARAAETLARLVKLRSCDSNPKEFVLCFELILRRDIKGVREVRICRNADFAQIIFDDGITWTFVNSRTPSATPPMLRTEGVISAGLIDALADSLVDNEVVEDGESAIEYQE